MKGFYVVTPAARGRRVYESTGYRFTGQAERDGKTLWFYEKHL